MKIEILNNQNRAKLNLKTIRQLTERLMLRAARATETTWAEISLVVTDDSGIQPANMAYLGHDESTDVVSLAFAPLPGSTSQCGEIIVNVQRAHQAAAVARWSPSEELALYIAHGCDHITGADDATPEERRRMRRRELRWLSDPATRELARALLAPKESV